MAKLRAPDGCPWDREQTHQSLARCLVEETSEVLECIDADDRGNLREELGDLLLQVVMHAQIAEEDGAFDLEDVGREINEKLIRRHPHVFGENAGLESAEEVLARWDEIKDAVGEVILREGGTATHHHAVGRDHRPVYDRQRPDLFAEALRAAKRTLDL